MKEYAIWGMPPNENDEALLYTRINTLSEAKRVKQILEADHQCTNVRIQTIDFTAKPNFIKALN